jgi:hypothetical protein
MSILPTDKGEIKAGQRRQAFTILLALRRVCIPVRRRIGKRADIIAVHGAAK